MSDITPQTIDAKGVRHLKNLANKRKKETGCKSSEAHEEIAKEHGFKNWNNVLRFAKKNESKPMPSLTKKENMFIVIPTHDGVIRKGSRTGKYLSMSSVESFDIGKADIQEYDSKIFADDLQLKAYIMAKNERKAFEPSEVSHNGEFKLKEYTKSAELDLLGTREEKKSKKNNR